MTLAIVFSFLSFFGARDTTEVKAVSPTNFAQEGFMTNAKLDRIIQKSCIVQKGDFGYWEVMYRNRYLVIITDPTSNRMRIMAPVVDEKEITDVQLKQALGANFGKALDAKYALYNGYLWSVFTHPLGELSTSQVEDAIDQVTNLCYSFCTSYASTKIKFAE